MCFLKACLFGLSDTQQVQSFPLYCFFYYNVSLVILSSFPYTSDVSRLF